MKNTTVGFLCNPFKVGAYCARVVIPYEGILELWNFLFCKAKEKRKRFYIAKPEFDHNYYEFMRSAGFSEYIDKILDDMLNFFVNLKDVCPEEIKKWSDYGNVVVVSDYYITETGKRRGFSFSLLRFISKIFKTSLV